jgi:hypothetical protein
MARQEEILVRPEDEGKVSPPSGPVVPLPEGSPEIPLPPIIITPDGPYVPPPAPPTTGGDEPGDGEPSGGTVIDDGGSPDKTRNIYLGYTSKIDGKDFRYKAFYASKRIITVEEEEIRGEKKMATGEIRVRWKKRRKIELEIPFFDSFNQPDANGLGGYKEFELLINAPYMVFLVGGDAYNIYNNGVDIPADWEYVIIKDKRIEYLDELIDKKIIKLTLVGRYNWYFQ